VRKKLNVSRCTYPLIMSKKMHKYETIRKTCLRIMREVRI